MVPASRLFKTYQRLSAFDPLKRAWESLSAGSLPSLRTPPAQLAKTLSLVSWNIDAFSSRPIARARHIVDHILHVPRSEIPDIIFLQEVTTDVRASLLSDPRIREAWLVTDAAAFHDVPFATVALLARNRFCLQATDPPKESSEAGVEKGMLQVCQAFRVPLPSRFKRDALCINIKSPFAGETDPGTVIRLINVHLDSLRDTDGFRVQQVEQMASLLREPDCSDGLIAGDFNAICPLDHELLCQNDLVDAWIALDDGSKGDGATWGFSKERKDSSGTKRLDKVDMIGLGP